ncbi:unnamed protein product [Alternaria alternata]
MVEWIGVAAAIPQLAKYGVGAANAVPDFARRVRKAPTTQERWTDQENLLTNLSLEARKQANFMSTSSAIIDRLSEDLNNCQTILRSTAIDTNDGKVTRLRKKLRVARKQDEMDSEILSLSQRGILCSLLAASEARVNQPV